MLCESRRHATVLSWTSRTMQGFVQIEYALNCAIALRAADALPCHQLGATLCASVASRAVYLEAAVSALSASRSSSLRITVSRVA